MSSKIRAPKPSDKQVESLSLVIEALADADVEVTGTIVEDGTMIVILREDEFGVLGRFNRSGQLLGDWS